MTSEPGLWNAIQNLPRNLWRSLFRNPLPSSDLGATREPTSAGARPVATRWAAARY